MKHIILIALILTSLNSCNFQTENKKHSVIILSNNEDEVYDIKLIRSKTDSNFIQFTFFTSGEIETLQEYRNGKQNGKHLRWRENGSLSIEGYKVNGEWDRVIREVYRDGRTAFEGKRTNNEFEGINSSYYKSGAIERQWNRIKSKDFGRSVYYHENGIVKEIGDFNDTGYVLIGKWDEKGEMIE